MHSPPDNVRRGIVFLRSTFRLFSSPFCQILLLRCLMNGLYSFDKKYNKTNKENFTSPYLWPD